MEQSREEFEKYIAKETGYPLVFIEGQRASNGYYNEFIDIPWRTWQASRTAVVVELPSAYDDAWNDQRMGFNIGIELCRETIEALKNTRVDGFCYSDIFASATNAIESGRIPHLGVIE